MTAPAFLLAITDAAAQPARTGMSSTHERLQTLRFAWLAGHIAPAISGGRHHRGSAATGHDRRC